MTKLIEILDDLIVDHWAKLLLGFVIFVAGRWWGRVRSKREWKTKEFRNRVTVSLNSVIDGKLLIRTVLEKEAGEILINDEAVATLVSAASKTLPTNPLIYLPKPDRWHILNAVLNEIAEHFKEGLLARDMGLPVVVKGYLFCLTREVAGDMRTQKIRVMLMRPELLESDITDIRALELASPNHATRQETILAMRKAYARDPEDFMRVEISLCR